ncbi:hypothetical protein STCU_00550 [Strigomonas culicis]|uniref:JAB1/MPN/MOV34 metalloenzyme domain-containing protein n=1 Tax=Strigomonas culicis TaxID=28005 RepID=S9U8T9_9TRYP|nr:hypothetical protein STCU_06803 [Strigomonas culicis]EPY36500.1 hypothetical protein STCU_00550 [Strigomonas culicis]|eukprot:EPY25179.1 hypothetical protein STCU_06803 [Strigomonas culicis]
MSSYSETEVYLTAYVSAAIVEHGKRRGAAAGYLLGTRTAKEIIITEYVPLTQNGDMAVSSKKYTSERTERLHAKQEFQKAALLGWYSASAPTSDKVTAEEYSRWCEEASLSFAHKVARYAVHLHCELPSARALAVRWTATVTSNLRVDERQCVCQVVQTLPVVVPYASRHSATEVVLGHVASQLLYRGGYAQPRSGLTNLDAVAFDAARSGGNSGPSEALLAVQEKLRETLQGPAGASDARIQQAVAQIRAARKEEQERQLVSDDYNTQKLKEALMIKYMSALLAKEIVQIEMLASQYPDKNKGNNAGDNKTNASNTAGGYAKNSMRR